jgi:hypothetical protein
MLGFARIRRVLGDLLDGVRRERQADPEAFGFSDDDVDAMVGGASGDTVTRERLLGPNAEAPLVEHLGEGEQPHHVVPGSRFAVEMDGDEMTTNSGYLVVTDERVLFLMYSGLTVGRNEVEYEHVETVSRTRADGAAVLTVRTPARRLEMRTDDDTWGGDLEAALDFVLARQSR